MTRHIAHRLDVLVLSVFQLRLQRIELRVKDTDVSVDVMNILLNIIDVLLILINVSIDHHQLVQFLTDVGLVLLQRFLLLFDLLLNLGALTLQLTDGRVGVSDRILLVLRCCGAPFAVR